MDKPIIETGNVTQTRVTADSGGGVVENNDELDKAQNTGEVVTSVSGIACDTAVKTHDEKAQSHNTIEDSNDLASILVGSDHPKSLDPETLELISRLGFKAASEDLMKCIQYAFVGRNVWFRTKPGMGKTGVVALACLSKLQTAEDHIFALVLCQKSDLIQYENVSEHIPDKVSVFCDEMTSGIDAKSGKRIVVGTPECILRHINKFDFEHLKYFILDECDKMLMDVDIKVEIDKISRQTSKEKQIMMFSATPNEYSQELCDLFQNVAIVTDAEFALHAVKHFTSEVEGYKKFEKLCHLLTVSKFNHAVVFVNNPEACVELVKRLRKGKVNVIIQTEAEKLTLYQRLSLFFGKKRVLVVTKCVSEHADILINFGVPEDSQTYVNRLAHCRAASAITLFSIEQAGIWNNIQKDLEIRSDSPIHSQDGCSIFDCLVLMD